MSDTKKRGRGRPIGVRGEKRPHFATALEYAMDVINDSTVTGRRRDTMAYWVLRTQHQSATAKPTAEQPTGKKAAATAESHVAHHDSDWGNLVQ